ncbi:stomatin-like protein 2, mitochondrial [Actinia tenebrosa]|uniref:Stomatin-like protein 2, mitochondrial n=1 Tax=Actinia tenebrosa TaxID=6105 RepID=A0A6P8IA31_ACTTE|nr:stomatin-like protein 2, mitochondrial [Actinia tenebrosa]
MMPLSLLRRTSLSQIGRWQSQMVFTRCMASYGFGGGYRRKKPLPHNTVVKFVPQQEAWIVERFGKFHRTLTPGLAILIPIIDEIKYVQSLKEAAIEIPSQSAITLDNVTLHLDGVLYLRVVDPYKASYGVEDPEFAVTQLAQTTMRSELGQISLDKVFQERETLNHNIVEAINFAAEVWGIKCLRYEIRDITLPKTVVEAMQMQVEAERKKRAAILKSEGERESAINVAEGKKQSQILASEATKMEQINKAVGEAEAIIAKAKARATGINKVADALAAQRGEKAAGLNVAELYVSAFSNLAKSTNTVVLPANVGDASSMVAQAMAVYAQVTRNPLTPKSEPPQDPTGSPPKLSTEPSAAESKPSSPKNEDSIEGHWIAQSSSNRDLREPSRNSNMVGMPHFTASSSPTRPSQF